MAASTANANHGNAAFDAFAVNSSTTASPLPLLSAVVNQPLVTIGGAAAAPIVSARKRLRQLALMQHSRERSEIERKKKTSKRSYLLQQQ